MNFFPSRTPWSIDPRAWWNRYNWKTTLFGLGAGLNSFVAGIQLLLWSQHGVDPNILVRYLLINAALSGLKGLVTKDSTQGSSLPDVLVDEKIGPLDPVIKP